MNRVSQITEGYDDIVQRLLNCQNQYLNEDIESLPIIFDIDDLTFDSFTYAEYWNIDLKGIEYLNDFFESNQQNNNFTKETIIHAIRLQRFKIKHNIKTDKISEIEAEMIKILQNSSNRESQFFAQHILHLIEKKRILLHSIKDGLTKLNNKSFAQEMLLQYIKRFRRYGTIFSILLIDIDYFKKINDNFGHNVGDIILEGFAKILKNCLREIDFAARWGGEEFIVILENCDEKYAINKAEHIRKKIEEQLALFIKDYTPICPKEVNRLEDVIDKVNCIICDNIECYNREKCGGTQKLCVKEKITCSIGVATCNPEDKTKIDATKMSEEIVNFADNLLYLAKFRGRNQVCH